MLLTTDPERRGHRGLAALAKVRLTIDLIFVNFDLKCGFQPAPPSH